MTVPGCVAVIPARYQSSRFPGKPLAMLAGQPMVQHVWRRCLDSGVFSSVVVATDDARIAEAVRGFGGQAMMTSSSCPSGTDRIAEVAARFPEAHVLVGVQGDEPAIHPDALAQLVQVFENVRVQIATLIRPLRAEERENSNVVKVVLAANGDALYFSRADIPFSRDLIGTVPRYAHIGTYGFRRAALEKFSSLPPSRLEQVERLEQLRALEHGIPVRCVFTAFDSVAVDTPDDIARAEALILGQ